MDDFQTGSEVDPRRLEAEVLADRAEALQTDALLAVVEAAMLRSRAVELRLQARDLRARFPRA